MSLGVIGPVADQDFSHVPGILPADEVVAS
jgi:hypothetical protein